MAKKNSGTQRSVSPTEHLEWLVRCRSQNQHTSVALYKLLTMHSERLKKDRKLATPAIPLIAVSFSLWRAVFLADRSNAPAEQLDHAIDFLGALISDNAISYVQDKNAREWTFRYYMNNARFRLAGLSNHAAEILPNFSPSDSMQPKEAWEHYQNNTDLAVGNYANKLKK